MKETDKDRFVEAADPLAKETHLIQLFFVDQAIEQLNVDRYREQVGIRLRLGREKAAKKRLIAT